MTRSVPYLLLLVMLLLAACGDANPATPTVATATPGLATPQPTGTPGSNAEQLKPGWIMGKATKADGTPLANVSVVIRGTTLAGSNTYFETEVDSEGRYSQKVPDGIYEITAHTSTTYNDRTYGLWLDPVDGISTPSQGSENGLVKDFVWRISGPTPDAKSKPDDPHSYYGGIIDLGDNAEFELFYNNSHLVDPYAYPEGSTIRLQLTPNGPLMDGSEGDTVIHDLDPQDLGTSIVRDIPLGDYTASATLVDVDGQSTPLLVASILPTGNIGDPIEADGSAPVIFRPYAMGDFGFESLNLFILPPR